jgi:hypothetical protein
MPLSFSAYSAVKLEDMVISLEAAMTLRAIMSVKMCRLF